MNQYLRKGKVIFCLYINEIEKVSVPEKEEEQEVEGRCVE
jgi:hypothetical protein